MYTATLKDRIISDGKIRWVVSFSSGADTFTESFFENTYNSLQKTVARKLAELNFNDTFTIGTEIDSTIAPVQQPTQEQIDRETWLRDYAILQKANGLISNGIINDTLPAYVAHKNKVTTNFRASYINYL